MSTNIDNIKLNNIKSAYEANGGGIKGVVAASQEAVKGYFTAGLSFIDNLTGGKLTAIKNKFTDGLNGAKNAVTSVLDNIKSGFQSKLEAARAIVAGVASQIKGAFSFNWKLPDLKLPHISVTGGEAPFGIAGKGSLPKFNIQWYADGGIMTEPTIFGAAGGKLLGGGEAGDEAILPLSVLWEKLKVFIHNEMDQGEGKNRGNAGSASSVISALTKKETKTLESKEKVTEKDIQEFKSGGGKRNIVIQKLEIKVDIEKIKDLPMLFKLIDEIKDAQNSTDEAVTA